MNLNVAIAVAVLKDFFCNCFSTVGNIILKYFKLVYLILICLIYLLISILITDIGIIDDTFI